MATEITTSESRVVFQPNLPTVPQGYNGASSIIFQVNESIVLKAPVVLEKPLEDAPKADKAEFNSTSFYSYSDLANERQILHEVGKHPNIVEALALQHPEGIYLKKYCSLSERIGEATEQAKRGWYLDIALALQHVHEAKIAHADLRPDNILCDANDNASICDFGISCKFGSSTPTSDDLIAEKLNVNGRFETVSDESDRFAFASLIFELETGNRPNIKDVADSGIPQLATGSPPIDNLLARAWGNTYSDTKQMVEEIMEMQEARKHDCIRSTVGLPSAVESLNHEVEQFRRTRIKNNGQ